MRTSLIDAARQFVLQDCHEAVVHIDLNRDQEEIAHAEDWNAFHAATPLTIGRARRGEPRGPFVRARPRRHPPTWPLSRRRRDRPPGERSSARSPAGFR